MAHIRLFALMIAAHLIGVTPALAERIASKQAFVEKIGGKKLTERNRHGAKPRGWMTIEANGRISGQTPNLGIISGTWQWKDRFYCRNLIVDAVAVPPDCLTVSVNGNEAIFTRHQGNGLANIWTVE
ncbi:hypothetical protein [Hoeflea poritis]|uniref:Uncharacterized protein n=1 Tax=Hoeflea poritis TaxID=2993659 RepID=A0ABT4VUM6_9HYPH|nr:hypothetical protein [Hoeflea poritis]MDA4848399.1 hypothetical protein [Hoeflea poritis]